jgi:hypothetical protein
MGENNIQISKYGYHDYDLKDKWNLPTVIKYLTARLYPRSRKGKVQLFLQIHLTPNFQIYKCNLSDSKFSWQWVLVIGNYFKEFVSSCRLYMASIYRIRVNNKLEGCERGRGLF